MRHTEMFGKRAGSRFSRLSIVIALSASALLSVVGPAHAVPAKDPLPADIPDYQAALNAVKSTDVRNAVCRFLRTPVPTGGAGAPVQTIPETAEPCQGLPLFTIKDPLARNEITPGFVAGTAKPLPTEAIELTQLVSSLSTTVNGRNATVMLAPTQGGGWHLAAIRDGDSDATYAGKASLGTLVFTEPQIRGWYQLKLTTVEPLNDEARQGLGGQTSVSLSDYQKLVKARYADKLPGSEYDTNGYSSGYSSPPKTDNTSSSLLLAGGSSAALALAGGAAILRRRRRASTG
ncbi:LPXTG cell wall anchor domain-containing protein [Streptomyces sp. NBC_00320]|uniref:LPXTG cell wall anchor domain-containing protein n=1 Tax=Streptomyces sp. NBC_00320 TaxID=2975711 RepID=UPI0022504DDF|nr:LPXTG cell wall anchor domain-containing protein [Streptomyces sp. NBC_00320]MCX5152355.1 LPXTG cell wall anchor domain-containing protein [Streptomyces sp. NBC_00320]